MTEGGGDWCWNQIRRYSKQRGASLPICLGLFALPNETTLETDENTKTSQQYMQKIGTGFVFNKNLYNLKYFEQVKYHFFYI
jgi:hypothetical protein